MHPTETPPQQDPSTDDSQPLLQRVFGHAKPDRHEDPRDPDAEDTVDDRTADLTQPEDQQYADEPAAADERRDEATWHDEQPRDAVTDEVTDSESRLDDQGDFSHDDAGMTPSDHESDAFDESTRHDPAVEAPGDDEPAADPRAAEPTNLDEPTDLKPGESPTTAVTEIWTDDSAQDLRDRWYEAQLRFIDDPKQAADVTRDLVNETVETLTAALASHREQLDSWPDNRDTEAYRMIVQRYRTLFERLLTV